MIPKILNHFAAFRLPTIQSKPNSRTSPEAKPERHCRASNQFCPESNLGCIDKTLRRISTLYPGASRDPIGKTTKIRHHSAALDSQQTKVSQPPGHPRSLAKTERQFRASGQQGPESQIFSVLIQPSDESQRLCPGATRDPVDKTTKI